MSRWDTSLFSCFENGMVFVATCFCLPCQLAYQKSAVNNQRCEFKACLPFLFCPCCCGVVVRSDIREKYGFPGTFCGDLLTLFCCPCCAVSQQSRQLDLKGLRPAGIFMPAEQYETIGVTPHERGVNTPYSPWFFLIFFFSTLSFVNKNRTSFSLFFFSSRRSDTFF